MHSFTLYTRNNNHFAQKQLHSLTHSCTYMHHPNTIYASHSLQQLHSNTQTPFCIIISFQFNQFHQSQNWKIQLQIIYHHHCSFQLSHFPNTISLPFSFILFTTSTQKNTSNLFTQIPPSRRNTTPFITKIRFPKDTNHFSPYHPTQSYHSSLTINSSYSILYNHIYITKIHSHYYHSLLKKHNSSTLILQFSIQTLHTSTNTNTHFHTIQNISLQSHHTLLSIQTLSKPFHTQTHLTQLPHIQTPFHSIFTIQSIQHIHIYLFHPFKHFQTFNH